MMGFLELRAIKQVLLALLISLALACAGGGAPDKASDKSSGQSSALSGGQMVGSISVVPGAGMPEGDHSSQFEKYSAAENLQTELNAELNKRGQFSDRGAIKLEITVTDFRLRSGAGAFWLGSMAGSDYISVDVAAKRGTSTVKTFSTNTSTALGGAAYASPTKRTARMIRSLAARIANGL